MIHLLVGSYAKKTDFGFFSVIGRETMLMKRCVLIGFHISTVSGQKVGLARGKQNDGGRARF